MKKIIMSILMMALMIIPVGLATKPVVSCTLRIDDGQYEDNEIVVSSCAPPFPERPQIDVVFVVDSRGSMQDEIRSVKTHIEKIMREVQGGQPRPDLRVGIVTYRDYEDEEREYLYRKFDLSHDIEAVVDFLREIEAYGGGDHPEAVEFGLKVAIHEMEWREQYVLQNGQISDMVYPNSKKLIFLIGDAAPHGFGSGDRSYLQGPPTRFTYKDMIEDAVEKGISIYTVSGSGIDGAGIRVWRQIAEKTGGRYTHLDYVRRDIDDYYQQEGVDVAFVEEAKADSDYDAESNTILTNNFGSFAKATVQAEAMEIGVAYKDSETVKQKEDSWLKSGDITGKVDAPKKAEQSILDFFRSIFAKLPFWR